MTYRKDKILILTSTLRTGSWICIMEMAKELSNDYEISVVGAGSSGRNNLPFRVFRIPYIDHDKLIGYIAYSSSISIFLFNLPLLFSWLVAMVIFRPKILLTNGLLPSLFLGFLARIMGIKVVCSHHGFIGCLNSFTIKFSRVFAKFIDLAFVNCEISKNDLAQLIKPEKIVVINHWTDDIFFTPKDKSQCRKEWGLRDGFLLLFVGSIDVAKRIETLFQIIHQLGNQEDILFLFAGAGKDECIVKGLAEKYDNVKFLGHIYDRNILAKLYAAADVLWAYADETYIAKPAVEALASGTPVIIPDMVTAYCKEKENLKVRNGLIPKEVGWILDTDDLSGIKKLTLSLKDSGISPEMRARCLEYAKIHHSRKNNIIANEKLKKLINNQS